MQLTFLEFPTLLEFSISYILFIGVNAGTVFFFISSSLSRKYFKLFVFNDFAGFFKT